LTDQDTLLKRWQYFIAQFVVFPAISWDYTVPSPGAITWRPFCLISPRYAHTSIGGTVILYATDSYTRPTTAVSSYAWAKISGTGSIVDNLDGTCTVTAGDGITKVSCTVTDAASETAIGYAFVHGGSSGNFTAVVSEISQFSGDIDNGEFKADVTLRGAYSGLVSNDGRDHVILMHVTHYWDGVADTFGGYKRDNNTFVLMCRDSEIYEAAENYYTVLHLEAPSYILKQTGGGTGEMKFKSGGAVAGYYTTANLTPNDAAYYILRETMNYHEYFNVSLWNNTMTVDNFNIRADTSIWDACRDSHGWNFGILYMNRWGNINGKPDPRVRYDEWEAIAGSVGDYTEAHLMAYDIQRLRTDRIGGAKIQAILPDMTIVDTAVSAPGTYYTANYGQDIRMTGLLADSAGTLSDWMEQHLYYLNTEYQGTFKMAMGHELNPGDVFDMGDITPTIADTITGSKWFVLGVSYRFDFEQGTWLRDLKVTTIAKAPLS